MPYLSITSVHIVAFVPLLTIRIRISFILFLALSLASFPACIDQGLICG